MRVESWFNLFDAIYLFLEHPAKDDNLMELTIVYN